MKKILFILVVSFLSLRLFAQQPGVSVSETQHPSFREIVAKFSEPNSTSQTPQQMPVMNTYTVTNTNDDAANGSLRWAITQANANPGQDLITFAIGSGTQTIVVSGALPFITDPVIIDGTTQPGFSG